MIEGCSYPDATDDELMRRTQANDAKALEQLYDRYGALAYRAAHAVCGDQSRAEGAVMDGYLSIWRDRAEYGRHRGTFKNWSVGVVRRRAVDLNRGETTSHRRAPVGVDRATTAPPSGAPEDDALARDYAETLRAAVGRLPDAHAEVITLALCGDLTHAEIAQRLSLSEGTVKGRMRLGLVRLRLQMSA